ncbi:DNA methyltransferase [Methanocaldococcus sp. 10A]
MKLFETKNEESFNHIADTYKGIYALHKYWSKKPYNVIRHFILKYTNKGDIVLDPFCGSGISVIEALFTNRKAIGIDINPSAIFITKQTLSKIDVRKVESEFNKLKQRVKNKIDSLYKVVRGNEIYTGTHFIWENGKLVEVWYKKNRKKIVDTPSEEDIKLATSFSYQTIPYFYPKEKLFYNPRINANKDMKVYELFTPRNLLALSILWKEINEIKDENVRSFFKFCFTASLGQASKMVFVVKRRGKFNGKTGEATKKEVGSWVIGYWIPKEHFEINVWNCFENRYRKILKAKKIQSNMNYVVKEGNRIEDLLFSDKNLLLYKKPAQDVLKTFPDNSIDYVITDPPHGDRQPYLELSLMWNSWLGEHPEYEKEIVISDSKERNKNKENYFQLLKEVFFEIERVLKPNHYFSLMFNSLDDETWIELFSILNNLNFELISIETFEYSAGSVVQNTRVSGLKTDFILTFRKSLIENKDKNKIDIISINQKKDTIIDLIEKYIQSSGDRGKYTYQIINYLTIHFMKQNKLFKLSDLLKLLQREFKRNGNLWIGRR